MMGSGGRLEMATRAVTARPRWQAALVAAITYAAGRLIAAAAMQTLDPTSPVLDLPGEIAAAVLVGANLLWLTPLVVGSQRSRTSTLTAVLFVSVAAVMLEGSAFAPTLSPIGRLPLGLLMQLSVSVATASVAVALLPGRSRRPTAPRMPVTALGRRIAVAALVYIMAYFITGAISYLLVTGPYYATHAGGLAMPAPLTVLGLTIVEGLLLTVGTIPLAQALTGSRRARALACGLALWMLGAVVPLLQAATLPDLLRLASAAEIFFQKLPLGIAIVWLFAVGDGPEGRVPVSDSVAEHGR